MSRPVGALSESTSEISENAAREGAAEFRPATWTSDRLLVAAEVAELLAVTTRWVQESTRAGLFPHFRLGKYVRYSAPAVLAWLAEQEQGGAAWRKHRPRAGSVPAGGTK